MSVYSPGNPCKFKKPIAQEKPWKKEQSLWWEGSEKQVALKRQFISTWRPFVTPL